MSLLTETKHKEFLVGAPYCYEHGPWVRGIKDTEREGLNCQTFVHEYYMNEFGVFIPKGMWSAEMYEDNGFLFNPVVESEPYVKGDIFFFGNLNTQPKDLHLAVFLGRYTSDDQMILRHANFPDQKVSDWSMSRFSRYERYQRLYRVSRLVPHLFAIFVKPLLDS